MSLQGLYGVLQKCANAVCRTGPGFISDFLSPVWYTWTNGMNKKSVIVLVVIFLSPLIVYFLWPSDENRIRKLFREGARAVEAGKIDDVMAAISFSYQDDHGLSYLAIKKGMEDIFTQWHDISVEYHIKSIQIKEKRATVELDVRVRAASGREEGYVVEDAGNPLSLTFDLEKEPAKWAIVRTEGFPRRF